MWVQIGVLVQKDDNSAKVHSYKKLNSLMRVVVYDYIDNDAILCIGRIEKAMINLLVFTLV